MNYNHDDVMEFRNHVAKFIHGDGVNREWAKDNLKKMFIKYKNDPAFIHDWKNAFGNDKI
jgi:hypothetical protein